MYTTNYPVFSQCYFRSRKEILMEVCSFCIFFHESFIERGLHISMNRRFIFSGGLIFRWSGHPIELHLLWWEGSKKIHQGGGTPIMPLPTWANPGLCCKRIKKKHKLQYALENLQEKDLNFTRKCTSSQINF